MPKCLLDYIRSLLRFHVFLRIVDIDIMLESDNRRINAKSIMGIMAFNPSDGMSVDIVTEGADEEAALDAIEKFLVCE